MIQHYVILKPANNPQTSLHHETLQLAINEAERLAKKYPQEAFTIYKSIWTVQVEKPEPKIEMIVHEEATND